MPIEFQVPSLRIQVRERLNEKESETIQLAALCKLEEHRIASLLQLEVKQRRRKAFVYRHWRGNEKNLRIGKPVLVVHTQMSSMSGKLQFQWI